MREDVVRFGKMDNLIGVVTDPGEGPSHSTAVLLLNSGLIHRVGPGRLYVKMARRFAAMGYPSLRFDLSGVGDSVVRGDNVPHDRATILDIQEAMDFLAESRGVERFVLMGICSGAVDSFNGAVADPRVSGIALLNPRGHTTDSFEYLIARHSAGVYWKRVLLQPRRWLKVLKGKASPKHMLAQLWHILPRFKRWDPSVGAAFAGGARTLESRRVQQILFFSQNEMGLDEIRLLLGQEFQAMLKSDLVEIKHLSEANHIFDSSKSQREIMTAIETWLESTAPHAARAAQAAEAVAHGISR